MKRIFLTGLFCLCAGFASAADSPPFEQANQKAKAGDFSGAAAIYREILSDEGPRASVLFNLGNCEQRLGRYGPAILAYERARLLTPRDPDLRANLTLARKAAAVFEEPGRFPQVDAFVGYLSLNEWSWLVAGSALFLGGLGVTCGLVRLPRRAVMGSAAVALLVLVLGAVALYLRRDEGNRGVVLSGNATVRLSPFKEAESLGTPGPGRIVHILKKHGGFHFVEVPGTGLRGWMTDKDVGAIH